MGASVAEDDLRVVERFARMYEERFGRLVAELNGDPTPGTAARSIRLCVEAMGVVLANQRSLAEALRRVAQQARRAA